MTHNQLMVSNLYRVKLFFIGCQHVCKIFPILEIKILHCESLQLLQYEMLILNK